ncbi:cation transporter [Arthrobacter bambusae]|uniref:Divalent metal cation (Fe/Co/Zn/Cd) transporter n=1 Tax=Arthrobacter bambusae TaxID=1338426 RepID=A0AAW8DCJ8_9MICC|nr:cation transporter [Arthrobacter bambusae]MDP9903621.1 divalent metal cation (Fe/Co/Zn/Cd) transporter [Arthrobacter bambusae]MDQ0128385.1 divalent metal cation (Fe/Co/Zn/Cd) transporter [Arthrobacter bambusae]MDQ0179726.1 divalent metal cation (Fe/Co/Zn/Cd) transporter [Arthrobacter bambusae]
MASINDTSEVRKLLLRRGLRLEYATLGWNVVGLGVLAAAAIQAGSPALAGFGLDSLIEIFASIVVVWQLKGAHKEREAPAMRLIGIAFAILGAYLLIQVAVVFATGLRPATSGLGIVWTALTFVVMLALAWGKIRTGQRLGNPVLRAEGKVTLVDAYLAGAVLAGLALNALFGWWWADPLAGVVIIYYAAVEARHALKHTGTP